MDEGRTEGIGNRTAWKQEASTGTMTRRVKGREQWDLFTCPHVLTETAISPPVSLSPFTVFSTISFLLFLRQVRRKYPVVSLQTLLQVPGTSLCTRQHVPRLLSSTRHLSTPLHLSLPSRAVLA